MGEYNLNSSEELESLFLISQKRELTSYEQNRLRRATERLLSRAQFEIGHSYRKTRKMIP